MRVLRARSRVILIAALAASVAGVGAPTTARAQEPTGLDQFMRAIASVESGGRYTARNRTSGAFGKYQIMPASWRTWARQYLGNANAAPTPGNQERVARAKMRSLHRWLASWRDVAYWWLTGRDGRDRAWSSAARSYVARVMTRFERTAAGVPDAAPTPDPDAARTISEASRAVTYTGSWDVARHPGYQRGRAVFATQPGATATLTFTGSRIAWVGPTGPTRGEARVLLDGVEVAVVDLGTRAFTPRRNAWSTRFPEAGRHTLTIEVLGTPGRPYVAIDAFRVTP